MTRSYGLLRYNSNRFSWYTANQVALLLQRGRAMLSPSVVSLKQNNNSCGVFLLSLLRLQIYHCVTLFSAKRRGFLSYTSLFFPAINKLRRLPAIIVINSPWFVAAKCIALAAGTVHSMRWSQILAQNRDCCLPYLHSTPPLGGGGFSSKYCRVLYYGKTIIAWLPDGENILKVCLLILTECTNVTDRHTDGHRITA